MDLFQQNDSGIMVATSPPPTQAQTTSASSYLTNQSSVLKPPKTPSRMYSRDRSNHSMSVAYSATKKNRQEDGNESLNLSHNQHLSRRNSSANNNLSILDSDAQSLPQGTFAMKAGPQTVMSQWVITLDDGDEDEEEEEEDVDEEGDIDEKNLVEVCDDVNRNSSSPNGYVPGLLVQNHMATHGHNAAANVSNSAVLSDQEERWEDALASRLDLLSTSSVNNQRNASNKSPNPIRQILKQQQQNKLNESSLCHSNSLKKQQQQQQQAASATASNSKYLQHSTSDNLLNYELNLNEAVNEASKILNQQQQQQQQHTQMHKANTGYQQFDLNSASNINKYSPNNLSMQSPPNKKSSTPNSTASLPSPPLLPASQPPSLNNSLDPFQTLLNQILADTGNHNKNSLNSHVSIENHKIRIWLPFTVIFIIIFQ